MRFSTLSLILGLTLAAHQVSASWSLPAKNHADAKPAKVVLSDRERLALLENQTHEFMGYAFPDALESIQAQLDEAKSQLKQMSQSLEQSNKLNQEQLQRIEALLKASQGMAAAQSGQPVQVTSKSSAVQATPERDELTEYQAAFALLQANKNQESLGAFHDYLEHFPQGKYTPNVLYWMASLELRQGQTAEAITRLVTLVNDFSSSQKAPSAWFKLAKIYRFQGNIDQAKSSLEMILSNYSKSSEAHEAEELMHAWFNTPSS